MRNNLTVLAALALISAANQVRQLEKNCAEFGVELLGIGNANRGVVHIIGPELGLTQPGSTIVCGDSHTSTHGAFGAIAFGIGTSQVRDVLASQSLAMGKLKVRPWTVSVEGEVRKPRTFGIEELLKFPLEERVYRMRCVEAWSMVIPWIGFEFNQIARQVEPTSKAKFVEFVTAYQPETMPGVRLPVLDWPYVEGLSMAEAMNDLTLMVTGAYGKPLAKPFGAPIRLHTPWKYGFKAGKSLVRITLTDQRPISFWEKIQPQEYGFWANVNPEVAHPRWSQATEEVLGESRRIPTILFNGYGEQVAHLYKGMENEKIWF